MKLALKEHISCLITQKFIMNCCFYVTLSTWNNIISLRIRKFVRKMCSKKICLKSQCFSKNLKNIQSSFNDLQLNNKRGRFKCIWKPFSLSYLKAFKSPLIIHLTCKYIFPFCWNDVRDLLKKLRYSFEQKKWFDCLSRFNGARNSSKMWKKHVFK